LSLDSPNGFTNTYINVYDCLGIMTDGLAEIVKSVDKRDYRTLVGIESAMKFFEWVPVDEIPKYANLPSSEVTYRLKMLNKRDLLQHTIHPYDGYRIYFEGYDVLALYTLVARGTLTALGSIMGVGKESVVYEAQDSFGHSVVVKMHREGRTSFKQVKRSRTHLDGVKHFSWIYAARLAAKTEYEILAQLYPKVSVPRPIEHNRNSIVMEVAKGWPLVSVTLENPIWYFDAIVHEIKTAYDLGFIHGDLSEFNVFAHDDGVTLIDWPQCINVGSEGADEVLMRDIVNIVQFFKRKYGLKLDLEMTYQSVTGLRNEIENMVST